MRLDSVLPTDFWGSRVPSIHHFTNVYRGVREGEGPQLCGGGGLAASERGCLQDFDDLSPSDGVTEDPEHPASPRPGRADTEFTPRSVLTC